MTDYIPHTIVQTTRLKVIEKHSKALAKELAELDRLICPRCPDAIMNETRLLGNGAVVMEQRECTHCGYEEGDNL